MLNASTHADPSGETFSLNASEPKRPNSARPEKASEKNTDAVFAELSLEICSRASPLPPSATLIAVSNAALDFTLRRLGDSRCVDADMHRVVHRHRQIAQVAPMRAVEHEHHVVGDRPDAPAGVRRKKRPRAVLPGRDGVGLPAQAPVAPDATT